MMLRWQGCAGVNRHSDCKAAVMAVVMLTMMVAIRLRRWWMFDVSVLAVMTEVNTR